DLNVNSHQLSLAVVGYQIAVIKGEMEEAENISRFKIGREGGGRLARFPEGRDLKELALKITTDSDHKFELALQLDDLETALDIVPISTEINPESITKWKSLGDRALAAWRFDLAKECFENAGDLGALMLLLMNELLKLAERAEREGQNNLAWSIWWTTGERERCVELLIKTGRVSEAALFARTYCPSLVPKTVVAWQSELKTKGRPKIAETIANPDVNPENFEEGWEAIIEKERGETPQTESPVLVDVGA
ncbi:hypothetical protein GYMLUDRAFT_172779, partial [Collybiopsis luxurians FD-317 M1]